ncbi:hypothetical protein, partial [Flagellimonas pacifica]
DNLSVDDADSDPNNEIQDLEDVIGEDASAGNNAITNLADPTNAQDAATKNYVDNLSVDDADSDPNNEIQDLEDVIGEDASAGNNAITNLADPTNAQDAATKNYVDNLSVDDADSDPNNEIQDLEDVIGEDASAGNNAITNLADPTNAQDAATKNYVDSLADDDVSVTNTVTGNRIATISETGITPVDINETVTSLSQNTTTGVISYTDEDGGAAETANVVSATNTANELIVGTDGGASFEMTDIDVDGDGTSEATVDAAMADITKVTAKSGRIFYPPSIAVDASTVGPGTPINLYSQYVAQYGTPAVKSPSAPAAIPTYLAGELHYYITYYDTSVFSGVTVSDAGIMNFTVDAVPTDYNSLINVVFVVK